LLLQGKCPFLLFNFKLSLDAFDLVLISLVYDPARLFLAQLLFKLAIEFFLDALILMPLCCEVFFDYFGLFDCFVLLVATNVDFSPHVVQFVLLALLTVLAFIVQLSELLIKVVKRIITVFFLAFDLVL